MRVTTIATCTSENDADNTSASDFRTRRFSHTQKKTLGDSTLCPFIFMSRLHWCQHNCRGKLKAAGSFQVLG